MKPLRDQVAELRKAGYGLPAAQMKAAHDVLLLAMHRCGFKKSSTVKGGVVMSHISKDIRRTTMDMDIAFVHRSISEASIRRFVSRLNCIAGIRISIFGTIGDLHHEDYNGKRAYIDVIDDSLSKPLRTKLDIGVHAHKELAQIEYEFKLSNGEKPVELNVNSKEQIFAEKLLSLLKHGQLSRRPKDVFDMYYLRDKVSVRRFRSYVDLLVYRNRNCRVKDKPDVLAALETTFASRLYLKRLNDARVNWLQLDPETVTAAVLAFLKAKL